MLKLFFLNSIQNKYKYMFIVFITLGIFLSVTSCFNKNDKQNENPLMKNEANMDPSLEGIPYKIKDFIAPANFLEKDWVDFHKNNKSKVNALNLLKSPWEQVNFTVDHTAGSYGAHGIGVIRSIAIQPGNTNRVIAGTLLAGVWITTNKGDNWVSVGQNVPLVETIWEVKFAPSNANIVYAITNVGLIKSMDEGQTWNYATNFLSTLPYTAKEAMLDISPTDSDKVFVSTKNNYTNNGGIYLTTNGGTTWSTLHEGSAYWDLKINPGNSSIIYAIEQVGSWTKFLRSTDSGVTFTEINNGYPSAAISGHQLYRGAIGVTPAAPNYVYVYSAGNDEYGFWKSTDAGLNFTKQDEGWAGNTILSVVPSGTDYTFDNKLTAGYGQTTWDFAIGVSTTNPELVYAGCNKTMFSTNGGTTWSHVGNPDQTTWPIHGDIQGIDASGDEVWVVSDGGAYYSSNNGINAISKYDGIYSQECWGFSQGFKSDIMAAGINHNAIYIKDGSLYNQWLTGPGADAQTATVNPLDDRYIYAMPWWDQRLTRPALRNTAPGNSGNLGVYSGYVNFQNYIMHPNLYNKIYVIGHPNSLRPELVTGVAVSNDNASSWSSLKDFPDISNTGGRMQVSFADANTMFAIIKREAKSYQIWKTNDSGVNWLNVTPSSSLTSEFNIRNIALSETDTNIAWVVLGSSSNVKVLKTIDGGTTWVDYSTGLPNSEGRFGIVNQRGTNGGVYIGTRMGVYYRNASMSSWDLHGTGVLGGEVNFLQINYAKGKIRAAGTRGIWENDLYESFKPDANFAADKILVDLTQDAMVQFKDHSAITQIGATWSWSFPGGIPSTSTDENPLISYANASEGKHDVKLTVKDVTGKESTKTITNFIEVFTTPCPTLIPSNKYSIHQFDSQEIVGETSPASNVIDGDISTNWVTQWYSPEVPMPHYISIDLSANYNVSQMNYAPRQNQENGRINSYQIHSSLNGTDWTLVTSGNFVNSTELQKVVFSSPILARYVKLTALSEVNGNPWTTVGELSFLGCSEVLSLRKEQVDKVMVYPVPTGSNISIKTSNMKGLEIQVSLVSIDGKQVKKMNLKNKNGEVTMDISDVAKGIYVLNLIDESGKKYQKKIIKK